MKTVIGLFDASTKAQHAMMHLQSLGIDRGDMELRPGSELLTERQRYTAEEHGGLINRLREFLGLDDSGPGAHPKYDLARIEPNDTVLICDTTDDMADNAAEIMNRDGAIDIDQRWGSHTSTGYTSGMQTSGTQFSEMHKTSTQTSSSGTSSSSAQKSGTYAAGMDTSATRAKAASYQAGSPEDKTLRAVEEELEVSKRPVVRGKVRIYTVPTEHVAQETVQLRQEHVQVERERVDRPLRGDEAKAFENQTIEVTETSEEPVVRKQARVKEEVHVRKNVEQKPQTVRETVRGTEVKVERDEGNTPRKH